MKTIYFAGGCFWCIASVFDEVEGISKVESGYSGGDEVNPTYLQVKKQLTGHRETIAITYDENVITYKDLVDIFLENIDPFDGEGQFIDRGHSYTTAIYYCSDEEKQIALDSFNKVEEEEHQKVKIALEPFKSFFKAEEEHQSYALKNPEAFAKEMELSGRNHACPLKKRRKK